MKKVLILGCLVLLLTGCGTKTKVIATPPELLTPPSSLLEDCKETPVGKVKTNSDLVNAMQVIKTDFNLCNNKIKALRSWYNTMETKVNTKKE